MPARDKQSAQETHSTSSGLGLPCGVFEANLFCGGLSRHGRLTMGNFLAMVHDIRNPKTNKQVVALAEKRRTTQT